MSTICDVTMRLRICYAGTYEREYPRNYLLITALREAGVRVEEAHAPVFEKRRDKSGVSVVALVGLLVRLTCAYLRLVPEVALRLLRCDALMIGYIGQADMLVLAPVARLMRKPVIFNPLVTLTDTLVEDRRRFGEDSLPARLIAAVDRAALHLADRILTDTSQNRAYLIERFGVAGEDIDVVPVGADERVFFPNARADWVRKPLDVLFYGKFIPLHGIDTIVRSAQVLQARGVDARFELVGTGQTWGDMRALAEELTVNNITWTGWIPAEDLGDRLRRADVALGVFDAGSKAERVVPNKVYQSLACGVATITRNGAAADDLLQDGSNALLVPPADPEALACAIERLADPDLRAQIAGGGRAAYETHASAAALARQLEPVVAFLREA